MPSRTRPAAPPRRVLRAVGSACARSTELVLIVLSLLFTVGEWDDWENVFWMLAWSAIALGYVLVGLFVVRESRNRPPERRLRPPPSTMALRWRFAVTIAASLTALGAAATTVLSSDQDEAGNANRAVAVVVMLLAWVVLHGGYARFYAGVYTREGGEGFAFPKTPDPGLSDMLYFSMSVGTTFAATDVDVTTRAMRWHVMVHGILAFFYNAAIIAIAISVITK